MAAHVEMLSGRRKKDYEAQQAAEALAAQAEAYGEAPPSEPIGSASGSTRRVMRDAGAPWSTASATISGTS